MKNFLKISVLLFVVFFAISCQKETAKETPKRSLLILVKDKSSSISQLDSDKEMEIKHLTRYLNQNLIENTDVVVMDINSHSDSRTNTTWFEYKAPKVQETNKVQSKTQQELEQTLYQSKVRKILKATQKKIKQQMYDTATSSNQTAIVELLHPISEILKKYDKASICVYSDFIQESNFRDFTKGEWAMPNKEYATNLAKTDFDRLQRQGLDIDLSKVTSFDVVTPNNPQNEQHYVAMPFYWDSLLGLASYNGIINWQKL